MKLTRQGVLDLNPPGHNNPSRRAFHKHFFSGPLVVVGHQNAPYDWYRDLEAEPIYAQRCLICGKTGKAF